MSRRVLGLLAVLLFLAGCGGAQTYPRTTVPVKVDKSRAKDPRLTREKLSEVDPCKVLDQLPADQFGGVAKPPWPTQDLRSCRMFLKPLPEDQGKNRLLGLDIAFNFTGVGGAKSTIGGLPAREQRDDEVCSFSILTDQKNKQGISMSYISKIKSCQPGEVLAKKMLETIRDSPPKWGNTIGSVRPCDLLDPIVTPFLGGHATIKAGGPEDIWHDCPVYGNNGTKVEVSFPEQDLDSTEDWGTEKKPMPLGNGVTGTQIKEPDQPVCRVVWPIRKAKKDAFGDVRAIVGRVEASQGDAKVDHCKVAVETAKLVASKVPKQ